MAKLSLVLSISDVVDPTLEDPHEVAQQVTDAYNEWAQAQGYDPVEFDSAEWEEEE